MLSHAGRRPGEPQILGSSRLPAFLRIRLSPSAGELSQYVGMLDSGAQTKASLAVMAAESSQNAVHLVGVMDAGIEYA